MQHAILKLITLCCFLTLGCVKQSETLPPISHSTPAPKDWALSPADAVLVAIDYASQHEIPLREYGNPSATHVVREGERFWVVLFEGKSGTPGDHFTLLIHDATEAVEYVAGE